MMARGMPKGRLEAFSDGMFAIIITIMVLELRVPHGESFAALVPLLPIFVSYVLSFVYVGIYWNNHHHMLLAARHVNGRVLWANLHLLFWLSLFPFATGWMGENHFATAPTALYGVVLLLAASAYRVLQHQIIAADGPASLLARAIGVDWKGKLSPVIYLVAIGVAFAAPRAAQALYAAVALMWLVPDRRIEDRVQSFES
jgi:TMEM175 potassium channel family protein